MPIPEYYEPQLVGYYNCGRCSGYTGKDDEHGTPCSWCEFYKRWVCATDGTCGGFVRRNNA